MPAIFTMVGGTIILANLLNLTRPYVSTHVIRSIIEAYYVLTVLVAIWVMNSQFPILYANYLIKTRAMTSVIWYWCVHLIVVMGAIICAITLRKLGDQAIGEFAESGSTRGIIAIHFAIMFLFLSILLLMFQLIVAYRRTRSKTQPSRSL